MDLAYCGQLCHVLSQVKHFYQYEDFKLLFDAWMDVATYAINMYQWLLAYEWPDGNGLWYEPQVVDMIATFQMHLATANECKIGLKRSDNDLAIFKP